MIKESFFKTDKALSKTLINLADYVINPYRGCTFGCVYCYTQYNKNILKHKEKWGEFIDIKKELPHLLEEELKHVHPKKILMGSTTELFQNIEQKHNITQDILKILKNHHIPFYILTKSYLIKNLAHLLNYHPENKVYFTFMFSDEKIRRFFEPNDSSLDERRKAILILLENNINVKIHIGPYIPYTDDLERLFYLIPDGIKEVEIEIYNSKVGNVNKIISLIKEKSDTRLADKVKDVYSSSKNYDFFAQQTKEQAELINKRYGLSLNIIVPKFDSCYNNKEILYEPCFRPNA